MDFNAAFAGNQLCLPCFQVVGSSLYSMPKQMRPRLLWQGQLKDYTAAGQSNEQLFDGDIHRSQNHR